MLRLPKSDFRKQAILQEAARGFEIGRDYSEEEVNAVLRSIDVEDHTLFRREPINFGYLDRDMKGSVYRLRRYVLQDEELERIKKGLK